MLVMTRAGPGRLDREKREGHGPRIVLSGPSSRASSSMGSVCVSAECVRLGVVGARYLKASRRFAPRTASYRPVTPPVANFRFAHSAVARAASHRLETARRTPRLCLMTGSWRQPCHAVSLRPSGRCFPPPRSGFHRCGYATTSCRRASSGSRPPRRSGR